MMPRDQIRFVIVPTALPLSASAAAGVDRWAMTTVQLLGALLVTQLEMQGCTAGAAMVRLAMTMRNRAEVAG